MKNVNIDRSYEPSSGASTKMKNSLGLKNESSIKELKKEFVYKNPNVKIGNGKLGPVELIIV
jgi:hypothetical protein